MFILIAIIITVGLGLYWLTSVDFEIGDGFTEMKKKIRDVDYDIIEKENPNSSGVNLKEMKKVCIMNMQCNDSHK